MPTFDPEYGREKKSDFERQDFFEDNDTDEKRLEFVEAVMNRKQWDWSDLNEDAFLQWLSDTYSELGNDDPDADHHGL